ncbi:hypothetical protein PHYSODRAFT_324965 [Phytophthora sojae]|uniref:Uncharacterized protein n=1 Tax=Phytophthora sojae (strain P6497) TaxID=1094619 RepID=G4YWQ7_PHYSP|nr:hypothetical protein PHYSODRAFT_324965 [Phytophthora sojae]EGZ23777.1 hypothetical protein PHYSODRAFT_324965 [Phytophthora sojae]|eukprot:XP_009519065.1 hypothetical protein PHYSODRAFT_324965 [Phytophthora sojae]
MESLILHSKDFTAAVVAIRQYWGSEHDCSDAELLALARREWEDAKRDDSAAREFVLQVVACRLEEQLLLWLMQFHASDAAEDMQTLVDTCSDPYFMAEGLELLSPLLDTLLTAAVVRAAACDRGAKKRKRRIVGMVEKLDSSVFVNSKAWSAIQALDVMNEDAGAWKEFLDLPSELEARLFNSRSGRAFLDEAQQVVALQQIDLGKVFGARERCVDGEQVSADTLWTLAEKLVELANSETGEDARDDNGAHIDASGTVLVVVESVKDLEEHLKGKGSISSPSITTPLAQDALVNVSKDARSTQEKPVMTISKLLGGVLNPLFPIVSSGDRATHGMQTQLNLYSLVLQLLQVFVTADVVYEG